MEKSRTRARLIESKRVVRKHDPYSLEDYVNDIADGYQVEIQEGRLNFGHYKFGGNGVTTCNGFLELEVDGKIERVVRFTNRAERAKIMSRWTKEVRNLNKTFAIILKPNQ